MITLKIAAAHILRPRLPRALAALLESARKVFTFAQERTNRVARFFRVVNAYRLGKPILDIVAQYGCSRTTVLRYARLAGLEKRAKGFDPAVRGAVIALYQQGAPVAQISAQLGVSAAYVSKTATEEGINRRNFKRQQ
jgi:uncharacterized protein YerC